MRMQGLCSVLLWGGASSALTGVVISLNRGREGVGLVPLMVVLLQAGEEVTAPLVVSQ